VSFDFPGALTLAYQYTAAMSDPVSRCKAAGIPADRVEEYKAAWTLFSPDLNSTLSTDALGRLLNDTFGCAYTPDDLEYMLKQFGDGGRVDFVSFASSLHAKLSDSRYNEAFGDAFDLLDTNKTGVEYSTWFTKPPVVASSTTAWILYE
jgi:Ca2+-binding EF-hand superfamily protein